MSDHPPYSVPAVRELERVFRCQKLRRPFRTRRYEPGEILEFAVEGVWPRRIGRVRLEIERFVGGGYAGQVYKVKVRQTDAPDGPVAGLEPEGSFALKILVPPSTFGRFIRNFLYALGFQGAFSLQSNPAAIRAGALWQKFIRRGAGVRFGTESAVVDVLAVLIDPCLGSCGEISEWVDGRMWRYEVDDDLFGRVKRMRGRKAARKSPPSIDTSRARGSAAVSAAAVAPGDEAVALSFAEQGAGPGNARTRPGGDPRPAAGSGSPEYRAKREFMAALVRLMHDMGAHELARQYEWWSLKSQPNALKRLGRDDEPAAGLTAVDFRAGMVLLPFLPQCPADVLLILRGLRRGSLVQFDRGDVARLEAFVEAHPAAFADLKGALAALKQDEREYRESLPDVSHHHVRLMTRPRLWRSICAARIRAWEIRNIIDPALGERFRRRPFLSYLFLALAALPLLTPALLAWRFPGRNAVLWAVMLAPLLAAPLARKMWGRRDYRRHVTSLLASPRYLLRAFRGRVAEALVRWHRSGRVSERRALRIARQPGRYLLHLPLSVLPPALHRFLTDRRYFLERLNFLFVRPLRLYFKAEVREKWLRDMVAEGERKGLLRPDEAARILSQTGDPFIQKYLKSLAVHMATLFVSETVFLTIAAVYVLSHPEIGWQQATLQAGLLLGAFNLLPVSPGSLVRGFYVLALIVRERNVRDYRIALGLSFFKIVGYIAFPLQMAYRYPELARFMAAHWATDAVHVVPIFGERGAWLEHAVFDLFYNFPLSLARRIRRRDEVLAARPKRRGWAVPMAVGLTAGALAALDWAFARAEGTAPALGNVWWAIAWAPFVAAALASIRSRRPSVAGRMAAGVLAASLTAAVYVVMNAVVSPGFAGTAGAEASGPASASIAAAAGAIAWGPLALQALWLSFLAALLGAVAAFACEIRSVREVPGLAVAPAE